MAIYLGIDGGGSKTACLLGDDITTLARGEAAGSNIVRSGREASRQALHAAIQQACDRAGIQSGQITRTVIGVAGAGNPEIRDSIHRLLSEIIPGKITVVGDMEIALHAGFENGPGAIVIAGTGSIAFGRNSGGETARAGGWGYAVSDEGSGAWIGRMALAAALRQRDEGGNISLLAAIQKRWNIPSFDQLIIAANATPPADFAGLFPAVVAAADAGDEVAQNVLNGAAVELASLAEIVIARLFAGADASAAMAGGVFRHCRWVREKFIDVMSQHGRVAVNPDVVDPVEGALAMARNNG